jgi:hypothetical protein
MFGSRKIDEFVPTGMAGEPGRDIPGEDPLPESRFIAADARCPYPERWHSFDGDSTEVEVADVAFGLVRALQPDHVLETGTAFGQVSEAVLHALLGNQHGDLWTLEVDEERLEYASRRLHVAFLNFAEDYGLEGISDVGVHALSVSSLDWTPPDDVRFGFVWLDSLYELRVAEFERFEPYLAPGAIVCFHDTAPDRGAHRIASGRGLRVEIGNTIGERLHMLDLPTPRGLTIAQKR